MRNIYDLSKEELVAYFLQKGEPKYRAEQVFSTLHKGVEVKDAPSISKALREVVMTDFYTELPKVVATETATDGTIKYLLEIDSLGTKIECVYLPQDYGNAICVSTQVGCKMRCAFCASGADGFVRDLTAGEILSQVILINACNKNSPSDRRGGGTADGVVKGSRCISNIVLMGSGEPFDNYDNTIKFLQLVTAPDGINIGARNISVSTAGVAAKIRQFADLGLGVNLCISLHAPNDTIRRSIMPIANKYPMKELIDAAKYFFNKTKRRVIFEYTLIDNVNCTPAMAVELANLLRGFPHHINLINMNDKGVSAEPKSAGNPNVSSGWNCPSTLRPPNREVATKFMDALIKAGSSVTMRKSRGSEISAACGQLKTKFNEKINAAGGGQDGK
jgi:23S rRNA (adenine2503-C2)-methyltransferase